LTLSDGEVPYESGDDSPYLYRAVSPYSLSSLTTEQYVQLRPAAMMHLRCISKADIGKNALFKSHLVMGGYSGIPFFSPLWVDKAVYVHRDPREILPSLADHMGLTHDEAAEFMRSAGAAVGIPPAVPSIVSDWSSHTKSWCPNSQVNTYVTSYQALHTNTAHVLEEILEFAEITPVEGFVSEAVDKCDFARMQSREKLYGFEDQSKHQERFFRRGLAGEWEDEIGEHLGRVISKDHADMMSQLGYLH
jgi:hypothetical protein